MPIPNSFKKRLNKEITPIKLNICTIYPGDKITPHMDFNSKVLLDIPNLIIKCIWVKAGRFPKGLKRHEKDTLQCKIRQVYLDKVPKDEWILLLDSDEVLGGAIQYIPHIIAIMEHNGLEVAFTRALEIDSMSDNYHRYYPRIFKNREGLKYGGLTEKHDWIDLNGVNYIDPERKDAWLLDFLFHVHYKLGKLNVVVPDAFRDMEIPDNLIFENDMEAMINE